MRLGITRFRHQGILLLLGFFAVSTVCGQDVSQPNLPIHFVGNRIFSASELSEGLGKCLATGKWQTTQSSETLEYCAHSVQLFLYSKGYLQAKVGKPQPHELNGHAAWSISLTEGALYRLGKVEIRGATILSPDQLRQLLDLKTGDVANDSCIVVWLEEHAANAYKNFGYLKFVADLSPTLHLKSGAAEGVIDLRVTVYEGRAFTIKSITFVGQGDFSEDSLRRRMLVRVGDIFSKALFNESLTRISETGQFETIDSERDVDYIEDKEHPVVDIRIRLKSKLS